MRGLPPGESLETAILRAVGEAEAHRVKLLGRIASARAERVCGTTWAEDEAEGRNLWPLVSLLATWEGCEPPHEWRHPDGSEGTVWGDGPRSWWRYTSWVRRLAVSLDNSPEALRDTFVQLLQDRWEGWGAEADRHECWCVRCTSRVYHLALLLQQ